MAWIWETHVSTVNMFLFLLCHLIVAAVGVRDCLVHFRHLMDFIGRIRVNARIRKCFITIADSIWNVIKVFFTFILLFFGYLSQRLVRFLHLLHRHGRLLLCPLDAPRNWYPVEGEPGCQRLQLRGPPGSLSRPDCLLCLHRDCAVGSADLQDPALHLHPEDEQRTAFWPLLGDIHCRLPVLHSVPQCRLLHSPNPLRPLVPCHALVSSDLPVRDPQVSHPPRPQGLV
eukprot:33227_2